MKVVHINTLTKGGAAKASIRQHIALLDAGINSEMLFLFGNANGIPNARVINPQNSLLKRGLRKLGLYLTQSDKNEGLKKGIRGKYEFVSFPWTDYRLDQDKSVLSADVINLHWVANFIDYPSFFQNIKNPVLWTMHDMNPLLGLYHYSEDEVRSLKQNDDLDCSIKQVKQEAIKNNKNIYFVAPSQWLCDEIKSHSAFKEHEVQLIPYSLDIKTFHPFEIEQVRTELGLPRDKKVFLFVSDYLDNTRKGIDLLLGALNMLNEEDVVLCTIGNSEGISYVYNGVVKSFGLVEEESVLAKLYSAADAFILPSRQDNLPNVMLEALACGTPVLSFRLGGMQDVIRHGENGLLSNEVTTTGLAEILHSFLKNGVSWGRNEIRDFALKNFTPSIQANKYIDVYRSLLENQK